MFMVSNIMRMSVRFLSLVKIYVIVDGKRRCTDILCIIVGLGLTITLAIFAIICYNQRKNSLMQPNT